MKKILAMILALCMILSVSLALAEAKSPVDGMTVAEIEDKLLGNTCGRRPTSCADQFAKAVRAAYDETHGIA